MSSKSHSKNTFHSKTVFRNSNNLLKNQYITYYVQYKIMSFNYITSETFQNIPTIHPSISCECFCGSLWLPLPWQLRENSTKILTIKRVFDYSEEYYVLGVWAVCDMALKSIRNKEDYESIFGSKICSRGCKKRLYVFFYIDDRSPQGKGNLSVKCLPPLRFFLVRRNVIVSNPTFLWSTIYYSKYGCSLCLRLCL